MQGWCRGSKWPIASCLVMVALASPLQAGETESEGRQSIIPLGLDLYMPVPEDNPLTPAKVALGRQLFADTLLSRDRSLSCASCHDPLRAFTDGRAVAIGVYGRHGTRNAPALINRGYGSSFFWDGRTSSLEEQVTQPILDPRELDMTVEEVVTRMSRNQVYEELFKNAFGRAVNGTDLSRALASYVRSILSGNAPIDRYFWNGEREALSVLARRGLELFRGKANCVACHIGPNFTDELFHNTGVAWRKGKLIDSGRYLVTGRSEDQGAFKTPTLREVAETGPYMHDGSVETLEAVLEFYSKGGNPNPYLDPAIRPLDLTDREKEDLVDFLKALSGTSWQTSIESLNMAHDSR